MGIALTSEQIVALAPDASSVAAGRKLSSTKGWQNLGQNAQALWGECQGSALYHIAVDLTTYTTKCSCPSHKFPCKHGLGLMLLAASQPTVLGAEADPPEWVATWLEKRTAAVTAKQEKAAKPPTEKAVASQSKAAEKRGQKVDAGIAMLDLWLDDLIRNGLASVESQPTSFWENQAARMVDAQAPGLATRLRRMAEIPGSSAEWPQKLLADLGQLALLTQAYARLAQLDPALQEDIRQSIGWTVKSDEIEARGETVSQRTKEEAHDYRYFPEPDLPPIAISAEWLDAIRAKTPELPDARRERFVTTCGLSEADAEVLVTDRATADYFEATLAAMTRGDTVSRAKLTSNWITGDLARLINAGGHEIGDIKVTPIHLAGLLDAIEAGTVSGKQAKDILERAYATGDAPTEIIQREGIAQMSDTGELETVARAVVTANPKAIEDYKKGKTAAVQFLIGQVMKQTKGRAKPDIIQPILIAVLDALP